MTSTFSVFGVAALSVALVSGAAAKELKLATFMSPAHHLNKVVLKKWATDLAAATNGSLTVKNYSGGALGKGPVQQYKRVVEGIADITFGVHAYTSKLFPRSLIAGRPGLGTTSKEVTGRMWDVYEKYLKSEYKRVKVLGLWVNWPAVLITRSKPVRSLADVKGMKIRVTSPSDSPQVKAWGAVPMHMGITAVYNAMSNGVIDAVYIAPSVLYRPWNISEPAKYVTAGMTGPTNLFFLFMNKKSWAGLSKEHKAAVDRLSGRKFSVYAGYSWSTIDMKALKIAKGGKNVEFIQLPPDKVAEFNKASEAAVLKDLAALDKKGLKATEIFKALKK
jgi:TRAP-type C4-dicarboxylate transport system substrate-binding protein